MFGKITIVFVSGFFIIALSSKQRKPEDGSGRRVSKAEGSADDPTTD
jgi:hypothetical protein